jgi:hypothetical protein
LEDDEEDDDEEEEDEEEEDEDEDEDEAEEGEIEFDDGYRTVQTARVREEGWCAIRRGCSPSGICRICNFWISSIPPMIRDSSVANARLLGKASRLKGVIDVTSFKLTLEYKSFLEEKRKTHEAETREEQRRELTRSTSE